MARKPRIHYPGALYHVMLRGNGGMDIFGDDRDRYRFFLFLNEGIERFGYRVYAYCLMDNHIHLAVQVSEQPLSRAMQNLSFRYTRWVNWRNKRTGHLFQGRYKAILVEAEEYLLQLIAYLHLNPVRAGMVEDPLAYRWSSHRAYMGQELLPCLSSDPILARFSKKPAPARKQFSEFVVGQAGLGHRKEFHGIGSKDSRIIGEDNFLQEVLQQADQQPLPLPNLQACIRLVAEHFDCTQEDLRLPGQRQPGARLRAYLAWLVLEHSAASLTELARWSGRDLSSLSSSIRRLQNKADMQAEIQEHMSMLREQVQRFATLQA